MIRIRVLAGIEFSAHGNRLIPSRVEAALLDIVRYATGHFGGVSVYSHTGSWADDNGMVITEHGRTFEILANAEPRQAVMFAEYVRDRLLQKAVVLTVEAIESQMV